MVAFPKSDNAVLREQDDLKMMRRPHLWPWWPVLPIKNYKRAKPGCLECGILCMDDLSGLPEPVVVLSNMFEIDENKKQIQYDSLEAIVADGWVVD
jgi:hypothetical protein